MDTTTTLQDAVSAVIANIDEYLRQMNAVTLPDGHTVII